MMPLFLVWLINHTVPNFKLFKDQGSMEIFTRDLRLFPEIVSSLRLSRVLDFFNQYVCLQVTSASSIEYYVARKDPFRVGPGNSQGVRIFLTPWPFDMRRFTIEYDRECESHNDDRKCESHNGHSLSMVHPSLRNGNRNRNE
jgi:hypothetical protein